MTGTQDIKLSRAHPDVKRLLAATYPEYKGRTINLKERNTYRPAAYWSGGTRYEFVILRLADYAAVNLTHSYDNPFEDKAHESYSIPDGCAVVETGFFCGKPLGIRIYVNSNTFPKALESAQ